MREARYDAVADFYEAGFSDPADPVVLALLDLLGPPGGLRVLDVACGHGRVARELARRGATVTAVDMSRVLLERAAAIETAEPLGVRYLHGDVTAIPEVPGASADAAVCNFGLSDIDDLDGALATVHRVLRPGGRFVFSIVHPCFPGAAPVSGSWPGTGRYYEEGYWVATGAASSLRRRVGANHRMLSTYVNGLTGHGLRVERMSEPAPPATWDANERRDAARLPVFLVVRCANDAAPVPGRVPAGRG